MTASTMRVAASAWCFRHRVEVEAEARFTRLAQRLNALGAARSLIDLALRSAQDERRHAVICAELARDLGAEAPSVRPVLQEIAPATLTLRGKVLYEIVAACCIAETESMGVLTTLLAAVRDSRLRRTLRELCSDEVRHSRLGWAHLASEHGLHATDFLAPLLPGMLEGNAPADLFRQVPADRNGEALLDYGVLPHRLKRQVFTETLERVIFPGLEACGVDTGAARAWLARRRAGAR